MMIRDQVTDALPIWKYREKKNLTNVLDVL